MSASKAVNFRPGILREDLEELVAELSRNDAGVTMSDVLRDGFTAYFPQIKAHLLARQKSGLDDRRLTRLTLVCAKAIEHGLSINEVEARISALLEEKLSA